MITRLVATCWSADADELVRDVAAAGAALATADGSHLVEARLDLLAGPPSHGLLDRLVRAASPTGVLVTCRPGGSGSPRTDSDRRELLSLGLRSGAAGLDWERGSGPPPDVPRGALHVASEHQDPGAAPVTGSAARVIARELAATGAHVVKLAAPCASAADALEWVVDGGDDLPPDVGWAPVPTGPAGTFLRLVAARRPRGSARPWSALAYVAGSRPLPGSELGQPLLRDALDVHAAHRVGDATAVHGVIGWPLRATWSPLLHGAAFRRRGADAILVPLPVRDMDEVARLHAGLDLAGLAVTMPHKAAAADMATMRSARVDAAMGANTLRPARGGGWEAEAFDGPAARESLEGVIDLARADVIVLGAGGAARAAAAELAAHGRCVTIVARRPEASRDLAGRLGLRAESWDALDRLSCDAFVNATPLGADGEVPLDRTSAESSARVVLDMVTTPPLTQLLARTRARGAVGVDGLTVLARQAAAQQVWWPHPPSAAPPLDAAAMEALLRRIVAGAGARDG